MTITNEDNLPKALMHPVRRDILRLMVERGEPVSPKQAAAELPVALNIAAYHCRVLEKRGVVRLSHLEQAKSSLEHFYVIEPGVSSLPLFELLIGTGRD
jgi:predicted transcriptional regulator